ncbi:hypothetical protein [Roseibium aggregatum]|uniref:Uncharacterized protein n=1 Tax=Roseibium aggregatum TaxID=187304 RepID=A0A926P465_9HYPH|nr:hypothetical protein [Roseibium aggregatum]MBD1546527.1 hypothetical protein [Roseibium aggregatum]
MQVNPVSSISYRIVRPKRASMGETESERQTHVSPFSNLREAARNEFEVVTRQPARANATTSFFAQLTSQDDFEADDAHQRDLNTRAAHAYYRTAASPAPAATTAFTV